MKVRYKECSLRPYPGTVKVFRDLKMLRAYYESKTGEKYPYKDEVTGGRFIKLEFGKKAMDTQWLVYAKRPHSLAHELTHILLRLWEEIGSDPAAGNGEPFCYMLSQLMLDARGE
jgi:hypothetical protein